MLEESEIHSLLSACLDGEETAQKQFYELFLPYVFTIVRRLGVPDHNLRDVVQEVFIELFLHLENYNADKGTLKTWVRTITTRKVSNYQRTNRRYRKVVITPSTQPTAPTAPASSSPNIVSCLSHQQLENLINELPEQYRRVFRLKEIEGYSHLEIAQLLDISPSTSRTQLTRAKAQLRTIIKQLPSYDHR